MIDKWLVGIVHNVHLIKKCYLYIQYNLYEYFLTSYSHLIFFWSEAADN
jgi:hypothetical protein